MADFLLPPTRHTPLVQFLFSEHRLEMRGELYPENAALFFAPLMEGLQTYLGQETAEPLSVVLDLLYMNSASTKRVFQLIAALSDAAEAGRKVTVQFESDPDNELMAEFVGDLVEDFPDLPIKMAVKA